ncbi:transmembrane protein 170B isoform X1 [Lagopus muta]|uniref:transmembrane protein 170B isoform X1 n=1 Tax=Lagopus muta TaxID=64668 RepID=UPI00209E9834|nr:transmembrane protein 170B isoform X1 [Lagopus muta]
MTEHLLGRQGQPRGAQVQAMHLSDWKGWNQDPPLPRPHLRAGSGGKSILLEIPAYLWTLLKVNFRPSKKMWYWVFLWALFSSLFVHGAVGVLMFVMLQRHRQGRLISVIVVSIGFLGSVTGAMITSAAVAGIYRVAGKNMAPLEALVFGVGQTVLTLIISFSRILATL